MRVQEAAELVAIDVYKRAEKTGERITLAVVNRRGEGEGECRARLADRIGVAGRDRRHQAPVRVTR